MRSRIALLAFVVFIAVAFSPADAAAPEPYGLASMQQFERLPYLKLDTVAGGQSSYDRTGGNADWGNYLYTDANGDDVLLDLAGPGTVYRIWMTNFARDGRIKIYFDGEATPRVNLFLRDFFAGNTPPFLAPLVGNGVVSSGGYYSYVPLPFQKNIKITVNGQGTVFYYNIGYHRYSPDTSIVSWTDAQDVSSVRDVWRRAGSDPKSDAGNITVAGTVSIPAGATQTLADVAGPRSISSIKLKMPGVAPTSMDINDIFNNVWLRVSYDDEIIPSILAPLGSFFGIGQYGFYSTRALAFGIDASNTLYFYLPMPFQKRALVQLVNQRMGATNDVTFEIKHKPFADSFQNVGYLRTQYRTQFHNGGDQTDLLLLDAIGTGHLVGVVSSMEGSRYRYYLEGDERVYVDDNPTPVLHGTGTEDFFNGGFYFMNGTFTLPLHGNTFNDLDGARDRSAAYRLFLQDAIPFTKHIQVGIEHGGKNDIDERAATLAFYYARPEIILPTPITPTVAPSTPTPTPTNTPVPSTSTHTPTITPSRTPTATPTMPAAQCKPSVVKTLPVAGRPKGIAIDPATQRAYVALFDTSAVAVIDSSDQVIATWSTGSHGHANSVAVITGRVFVSMRDSNSVAVLNANDGTVIAQIPVGVQPYGVSTANGRVVVANFASGTVSLIDPAMLNVVATAKTEANPAHLAATNDRSFVSLWDGGVGVIDANGNVLNTFTTTGRQTFGIAANPPTNRLYTANRSVSVINQIDASTNAILKSVRESLVPFALALNPASQHLFVVLPASSQVRVRDATTLDQLLDLPIGAQGNDGGDGIAAFGNRVYVSNNAANSVTIIDDGCGSASPTSTPTPTATSTAPAPPTITPSSGNLRVSESSVVINAYNYQPFLVDAFDNVFNLAYKRFNASAYNGAPRVISPKTLRTVIVENEFLRLTFLPEIGGRLWQVLYKPTGQTLLYNNKVLKPSPWGPSQQGGWLGIGGMEWALPVDEHGYEWGVPWQYAIEQTNDRATITLWDTQASNRVRAQIAVTLPANAAYLIVHPRIENPTPSNLSLQFWVNAQLALGSTTVSPETQFILPATQVFVHSTGDSAIPSEFVPPLNQSPAQPMPWSNVNGRDLAWYKAWTQYLGVFTAQNNSNVAGAYNHANDLGVARIFPPDRAPGVKLFAWGPQFRETSLYTDDGSTYFELWGGLPRTFFRDENVALPAGTAREWDEYWIPFARTGGLSAATTRAVLGLDINAGNRATVGAYATLANTRGNLILLRDGAEFRRWSLTLNPSNAFREQFDVPRGGKYVLRFIADDGTMLAETK